MRRIGAATLMVAESSGLGFPPPAWATFRVNVSLDVCGFCALRHHCTPPVCIAFAVLKVDSAVATWLVHLSSRARVACFRRRPRHYSTAGVSSSVRILGVSVMALAPHNDSFILQEATLGSTNRRATFTVLFCAKPSFHARPVF